MEPLAFLTEDQVRSIQKAFGTPVYVYDQRTLEAQARAVLNFPNAFGLTARYAMKAAPSAAIIRALTAQGLHIDASSGFEAERALRAGVAASHIQITAQEMPKNVGELVARGVLFNACSLAQLRAYGELFPGAEVSVRVNPGLGSGHSNRTNTGGPSSSFGIWRAYLPDIKRLVREYSLRLTRMHTHIGSGSDPEVWNRCAKLSLEVAEELPEVTTLSLGGGFKVGRMPEEKSANLQKIGAVIVEDFKTFYAKTGRKLRLEIEPGTFLAANAGAIIATVIDVVDTGPGGYRFIKIDSGMTEILRPALYGAQHPISLVSQDGQKRSETDYIVAGHCCESGDILTPEPANPEGLRPRRLPEAKMGDALVIGGAGAYCAAMPAKNYNSFPEAPEVLIGLDGAPRLIRERQTLEHMLANERIPGGI